MHPLDRTPCASAAISASACFSRKPMPISRYIVRSGEVFQGFLPLASVLVELAEAEVAVGDKGTHAAGPRERLTVLGLAEPGIDPVGMGRNVAEEVQHMGRELGVTCRKLKRAVAQAPRRAGRAADRCASANGSPSPESRRLRLPPDA